MSAAPARDRVRLLAICLLAALMTLSGRAVQLAFAGDPVERDRAAGAETLRRADIVDRNGVLLATTVRAYALTAAPAQVWDPEATAAALRTVFPELSHATLVRRMSDRRRTSVFLRRGLDEAQRQQVLELGQAGLGFQAEDRRVYPNATLGAHVLGFTDVDLNPLAGVERGLDQAIRSGVAPVRLSLDVRVQFALETELAAAARAARASGGAGIILDGRNGEVLALASWPSFDPNSAGDATDSARRERVGGDLHELGSTIKPFTVAMALQDRVTFVGEQFDLTQPLDIDGQLIDDHDPAPHPAGLSDILAHSSNIGAARLALRLNADRQRAYLDRLGLTQPAALQLGRNQAPLAPPARGRRDIAALGFGYGLAATPASLAGAYTVFVNGGRRVAPTLVLQDPEQMPESHEVFTPQTTQQVLAYLRASVVSGTGRGADVPGLAIAGKTGTAEKLDSSGNYDANSNYSSFAGVFPADAPRFVIVVALDGVTEGAAGGVVAAPVAARTLRRSAPMLGLRIEQQTR